MAAVIFFYLFALLSIVGGLGTVLGRNPVHSVLWLILSFISAAGLFVLAGAEFVAMLLVIVYVGAVAVLFLFVVMMLDVDFSALRAETSRLLPVGLLIGLVILLQLGIAFGDWHAAPTAPELARAPVPDATLIQNTAAIGQILYDEYFLAFQMAGLVLLVAMIGAIVLTLRHRQDVKRQNVMLQMSRDPKKAMAVIDVKPGQGLG
ncbi:NADH dehydrogenase subunit J [Hasllibacter halocynthiae]|uniref:NADH-quinone oxidoreductase subunit J n=1 Tax=Hasllibacter halocynthiae TaxID=595589 RepID=A0A2T0X807_9RHOB|nr:NADH-quinone oxidoreductase subunit J [Hasllibacter halocynthiae]PRY95035.1 NADH dehydrogenase subunit J [Hasllibacter halocynthiae]